MSFGLHVLDRREFTFLVPRGYLCVFARGTQGLASPLVFVTNRRPKSVRAPFHGTSARETGECAAADEDAASSTARLGARRDQQISVDILSVMEDG